MSIYDFEVARKNEKESLSQYQGKVLLIVNTATKCGFTPQYDGLEALYEKYNDKGFEILDFPCNQFFAQAPGDDEAINEFCVMKFGTKFPRFSKVKVNGKGEEPLFRFLKDNAKENTGKNIKWNFTKFLVDRSGNVVRRFEPTETPEKIAPEIEKIL